MDKGGSPTEAGAEADISKEEADIKEDPITTTTTPSSKTPSPSTPRGPSPKNRNIPQAARLPFFLNNWKQVTNNNWILRIVKEGYKLQFDPDPPLPRTFILSSYSKKSSSIIRLLLADYLHKGAIMVGDIHPD